MKFLDDIKNQPQHIREIMFGLSVFITVLLVGIIWFSSFQRNLYALINSPEEVERILAVENASVPSPFGLIWQTAGEIKGLVSGLWSIDHQQPTKRMPVEENGENKVYTLPLSEYK